MHEGVTLTAGMEVIVWLHALHHDPDLWGPTAEEFDPDRFLRETEVPRNGYFPFLDGQRRCAGQHLAVMELTIYLSVFLRNFDLVMPADFRLVKRADGATSPDGPVPFTLSQR